jgi:hypothetical protein
MLARVQNHQNIHLGAQFDEVTRLRVVFDEVERPIVAHSHFAEEIHICRKIAQTEPGFFEFNQKVIARVAMKLVARLLIAGFAILGPDSGVVEMTADRIVPSARVLRYGS